MDLLKYASDAHSTAGNLERGIDPYRKVTNPHYQQAYRPVKTFGLSSKIWLNIWKIIFKYKIYIKLWN